MTSRVLASGRFCVIAAEVEDVLAGGVALVLGDTGGNGGGEVVVRIFGDELGAPSADFSVADLVQDVIQEE